MKAWWRQTSARPTLGEMSGVEDASVWTVVVAAGSGTRFGARKQFLDFGGVRVIDRTVAVAAGQSDGVVVVLPADAVDVPVVPAGTEFVTVAGGESRSESVRNGLAVVPADCGVVLVHDGARPMASVAVYERVIAAVRNGAVGVVPAVPVVDSIRHAQAGAVDRSSLVAVQTPQGFDAQPLRAAHASGADASDDATLVEAAGHVVVIVEGDPRNVKLTTPFDLEVARLALAEEAPS